MKNVLEYKGYLTKIEYSVVDRVLYGKIEGIKDLVNFESSTIDEIEQEFHAAVDDYIQLCEELGESPDKAYSGTFNVRISPDLHRKIAMRAFKAGESLNSMVERAIEAYTTEAGDQREELLWKAYNEQPENVGYANYYSGQYSQSKSILKVVKGCAI